MKLYYYKSLQGNFGDDLNAWLWEELAPGIWNDNHHTRVCAIGTIIGEQMPTGRWIVMSSGIGYAPLSNKFPISNCHVICVRGPLTAKVLGLPPEKAVTDGAMLLSLLPDNQPVPESQRHGIVFMPHHGKTLRLGRWRPVCAKAGIEFLDPRTDSKKLLHRIRHAKLVVAEAMHAVIVADTMRVPWVPLVISSETNSFKWLDWTGSMKLPYVPIMMPSSSLLESLYSKIIAALNLNHAFTDLSEQGALRHFVHLHERENFWSDRKRNFIGKSFRILGLLVRAPFIKEWYEKANLPLIMKAAAALSAASLQPGTLSETDVYAKRKARMKECLDVLIAEAKAEKLFTDNVQPIVDLPALKKEVG